MWDSNRYRMVTGKHDMHRHRVAYLPYISIDHKMETNHLHSELHSGTLMCTWDVLITLICKLQLWAELIWLRALDIGRHAQISLSVLSPILVAYCSKWKEEHCEAY